MKPQLKNRRIRAFTLIELLVVMLILGILAALIIPKLFGATDTAKIAAAKSDISELKGALSRYRVDNDQFPTTEDGLQALVTQPADATNWKGPYLDGQYLNDPWHNPFDYVAPDPNGTGDYLITCYGADGAPGGDGINGDITSDDPSQ
jgi:general secretion pathway protein G